MMQRMYEHSEILLSYALRIGLLTGECYGRIRYPRDGVVKWPAVTRSVIAQELPTRLPCRLSRRQDGLPADFAGGAGFRA